MPVDESLHDCAELLEASSTEVSEILDGVVKAQLEDKKPLVPSCMSMLSMPCAAHSKPGWEDPLEMSNSIPPCNSGLELFEMILEEETKSTCDCGASFGLIGI